jgi:hypothetical protein
MGKLFIIDMMPFLYKGHFVFLRNPRLTSTGINTSALLGLASGLQSILKREKPTHAVLAMDPGGPTFRHEAYPQYKAQREKMPEDLAASIPYAFELAEALRIPVVRVDGFEDLEGTDGIESIEDNEDLKDPSVFKGRLNAQYLNAFLSMKYSESTKLDEGKCNGLRSMLGLPLQGTITTQCDMFCNRYPLEDALKLFGAMDGKGAQTIK